MCNYDYRKYDLCGHQIIELSGYCQRPLWEAGMSGILKPCPEEVYIRHILKLPNASTTNGSCYYWKGTTGFCRNCEVACEMPKVAHYATHNDAPFPSTFDNGPVVDVHPNLTPPPAISSAAPLPHTSKHSIPIPRDLPYIYTPWLRRSIHQLLSIDTQYGDVERVSSPELFFPPKIAIYDLKSSSTSWRDQWTIHAHINGVKLEGCPSSYFAANGGMTPRDKRNIVACVAKGFSADDIFRSEFAPRGMSLASFELNWQRIEAIVVSRAAENADKWEKYVQRDLRPPLDKPHPKSMGGIGNDSKQF